MNPDAIIVLSAGAVQGGDGLKEWRSTTYDESDAFGTLGGRARVEAAAFLAREYPDAAVVTTSRNGEHQPTQARIYADELVMLGVPRERIVEEINSSSTGTAVHEVVLLAEAKGWHHLLFVSSEYHLPRIETFYRQEQSTIGAVFISAESVCSKYDQAFAAHFEEIKKTSAYQIRLAAEAEGVKDLEAGAYRPAPAEDKKERPV
jgi:uncharacterized SAM-binding protein YcdF (DUF218 family)